jgi:phage protein D
MGLTPVVAFGGEHADIYQRRLHSLLLTDNPGFVSDTLLVMLDGHHDAIKTGERIRVSLGWQEDQSVWDMGEFVVNKISPQYFPTRLKITATATALHINSPNKSRHSESYTDNTVADIVQRVSTRMGLSARIHHSLKDKVIVHIDQKDESDLSFLQRVAGYYDAVVKIIDNAVIMAPRGQSNTFSGNPAPIVALVLPEHPNSAPYNGLIQLAVDVPEREQFKGVKVDYYDQASASIQTVQVGNAPFYQVPGRYLDHTNAKQQAHTELNRIKRQSLQCHFTVPGNPQILAEGLMTINGAGSRVDGLWCCDQVVHEFIVGEGFVTRGRAGAVCV